MRSASRVATEVQPSIITAALVGVGLDKLDRIGGGSFKINVAVRLAAPCTPDLWYHCGGCFASRGRLGLLVSIPHVHLPCELHEIVAGAVVRSTSNNQVRREFNRIFFASAYLLLVSGQHPRVASI